MLSANAAVLDNYTEERNDANHGTVANAQLTRPQGSSDHIQIHQTQTA